MEDKKKKKQEEKKKKDAPKKVRSSETIERATRHLFSASFLSFSLNILKTLAEQPIVFGAMQLQLILTVNQNMLEALQSHCSHCLFSGRPQNRQPKVRPLFSG